VNRAPLRHPNQTPVSIEEALLGLRQAHMTWGPRNHPSDEDLWPGTPELKRILERDQPGRGVPTKWLGPATSTMGEIVKRAGLVVERRKRRRTEPYTEPLAHAVESNKVWCGDFKGWFRSGDGTRIDPLTITDACSRYLLRSQAVEKTDTERVRSIFEAAFREYGLPWAMRTDNGPLRRGGPARRWVGCRAWRCGGSSWASCRSGSRPGIRSSCPERMYRTLKQDLRPAENWRSQQRELDRFRHDYNQVRPHEALGMRTPASVYEPSPRPYPERLAEIEYPDTMLVRTVQSHGHFRWKKHDVFLSEVLWGERVGLLPFDDGCYSVYFAHVPVALFEERTRKTYRLPADKGVQTRRSVSGAAAPETEKQNQEQKQEQEQQQNLPDKEKLSGMCPV
jgi:transposase InsO family protein